MIRVTDPRQQGSRLGWADSLFEALPIHFEPKDEADELRRQFIESTKTLAKLAARIEHLDKPSLRSAA